MTPLGDEILSIIRQEGPLPVARYMELALGHPRYGYYTTRDPLGRAGDFTTSPEISQMFGELIGLWLAQVWSDIGAPPRAILAEAGPGRGTLLADALRAARALPAFRDAIEVHLIEISPVLREAQARTLAAAGVSPRWHDGLDGLPTDAPLLLVANEFLDALPIRQYQHSGGRWHERLVGEAGGRLAFGLAAEPEPAIGVSAAEGAILEVSPGSIALMRQVAGRIRDQGGAALVIDYGHAASGFGDTLQAMRGHDFVDPLAKPGAADITAHVDFAAMSAAASIPGVRVHGPVTQGDFLRVLGIDRRTERLIAGKDEARAAGIAAERDRLTDMTPRGMGALFKVLAVTVDGLSPAGF